MNRNTRNGLIALLVLLVLLFFVYSLRRSSPYANLITNQGDTQPNTWIAGQETQKCIPGMGPGDSYYTGENSGGICGAQQVVHKLGHEYQIEGGIGGPLLDK